MVVEKELRVGTPGIYDPIVTWWERAMHQDPSWFIGAKARAEGAGMNFDQKLLFALKVLFDQGIL